MGLGITFVLVLLAFNANCEVTVNSLVNDALSVVTSRSVQVSEIINENIKIQKNLQTTLRSLEATLPDAIVSTYLGEYINNLESLYQYLRETNETTCFMGRGYAFNYIKAQTSIYYKLCVSRFSKSTTEDELKLITLNKAVNSTIATLRNCGNSPNIRRNLAVGRLCVEGAKETFEVVVRNLNTNTENQVNYPQELSNCLTNTVNRAEDIIESLNDVVTDCVKKVSDSGDLIQMLPELLPNPTNTLDVFNSQTIVPVSDTLKNLGINIQTILPKLKVLLETAANVKIKAENSGSEVLSSVFTETNTKLAGEELKFASIDAAKPCIANFRNLLNSNNNNRVTQLKTCVSQTPKPNFDEVKSIESNFLTYVASDKEAVLNCMANINNIFPIGGIQTCIVDKRKDDETIFTELFLRLEEVRLQTELIERRVTACTISATNTGTRQLTRDIPAFVACIRRNTDNSGYTFP